MVSVIIPVYNEEDSILDCLSSLSLQSHRQFEIIVVDDGSTDQSVSKIKDKKIILLKQSHLGPGPAKNLGVKHAKGNIMVFVDADMTFEKNFIKNLTSPIIQKKTIGTFTKDEFVSNWNNIWARCWNWNQGLEDNHRIPNDYPDTSPVFRAILKSEFDKVKGFDNTGFTDDWSLSKKLGFKATLAVNAVCFHRNPETLGEVYNQARWIGKNEFIAGNLIRRLFSIARFNPITQLLRSIYICLKFKQLSYLTFSLIYYSGITASVFLSFFGEEKSK